MAKYILIDRDLIFNVGNYEETKILFDIAVHQLLNIDFKTNDVRVEFDILGSIMDDVSQILFNKKHDDEFHIDKKVFLKSDKVYDIFLALTEFMEEINSNLIGYDVRDDILILKVCNGTGY